MKREINLRKLAKHGLLIAPDLIGLFTTTQASITSDVSQPSSTQDQDSKLIENPTGDEIGFFAGLNEKKFKEFLQFLASRMVDQEFFCQPESEDNYQQFRDFIFSLLDKEEQVEEVFQLDLLADYYTTLAIIGSVSSAQGYLIKEQVSNLVDKDKMIITDQKEKLLIEEIDPDCEAYFWSQLSRFLSELRNIEESN